MFNLMYDFRLNPMISSTYRPIKNTTTILNKNRPKNTQIIMPFTPIANEAMRNRPAKFQKNRSETSQVFHG